MDAIIPVPGRQTADPEKADSADEPRGDFWIQKGDLSSRKREQSGKEPEINSAHMHVHTLLGVAPTQASPGTHVLCTHTLANT